jgi:hypothetical protein
MRVHSHSTGRRRRAISRVAAALTLAVLLLLALAPAVAIARAGGGQSSGGGSGGGSSSGGFSSGGSSSGSRSSGGSSPGTFGADDVMIIVGITVLVVGSIAVVFVWQWRSGSKTTSEVTGMEEISKFLPPEAMEQIMGGERFAIIRADDPDFNEEMFYGRVNEMFIAIQYAWMDRNMEPARRFLSDQQFSVLDQGVRGLVRDGQINKLENIHIDQMLPITIEQQGDYDVVKLLIAASAIDYTVDERTGKIVNPGTMGDGKTPKQFQEYWTLTRKVGAHSKVDSTINKCPNCGAPVTDGNYVKCAYCGMQMNDPALDWVLMRIEQVT